MATEARLKPSCRWRMQGLRREFFTGSRPSRVWSEPCASSRRIDTDSNQRRFAAMLANFPGIGLKFKSTITLRLGCANTQRNIKNAEALQPILQKSNDGQ